MESTQERAFEFHTQDLSFPEELLDRRESSGRLEQLIHAYDQEIGELNIIFCSDRALQKIHEEHLGEEDLTDIITFDHVTGPIISGDLFISIERVRENALIHGRPPQEELHRVMAHGILHLLGFKDKSKEEEKQMREAENEALLRWGF